jgi:hypothetical protein
MSQDNHNSFNMHLLKMHLKKNLPRLIPCILHHPHIEHDDMQTYGLSGE